MKINQYAYDKAIRIQFMKEDKQSKFLQQYKFIYDNYEGHIYNLSIYYLMI